ncbi:hypothetical protein SUGI_0541690 [Cryptomeria japonica]|nr:hypothetical protein SUGI_0541690 [Cryptomeria japonica]
MVKSKEMDSAYYELTIHMIWRSKALKPENKPSAQMVVTFQIGIFKSNTYQLLNPLLDIVLFEIIFPLTCFNDNDEISGVKTLMNMSGKFMIL